MEPDMSLLVAFAGGLAAFMSPCVLPMIPTYLFFLAGDSVSTAASTHQSTSARLGLRRDVIIKALVFVVGFSAVFVLFGAMVGAAAAFLFRWRRVMMYVAGALVTGFGAFTLIPVAIERNEHWLRRVPRLSRLFGAFGPRVSTARRGTYLGALTMGIAFSLAWGPCAGPIAGSIAAYASVWGDVGRAVQLLMAFSAGLAIPFLLAAVFVDRISSYVRRLGRVTILIRVIAGLLLIVLGLFVFSDSLWRIGLVFV